MEPNVTDQNEYAQIASGWVKLYHSSGALVTLPVFGQWKEKAKGYDYAAAFSAVSDAIGCGFTVNAPGLEHGEQREEVGFVLRMERENQDRTVTPMIQLYSSNPAESYKFLTIYLNNDDRVADFERASGLQLAKMGIMPGMAAPQRGKDRTADKLIVTVRPFPVIYEANPAYDPELAKASTNANPYKVPKRVFIRWGNLPAQVSPPTGVKAEAEQPNPAPKPVNPATSEAVDQREYKWWLQLLENAPNGDTLTTHCRGRLKELNHEYTRRACYNAVCKYAAEQGIEYDPQGVRWVDPVEAGDAPTPF